MWHGVFAEARVQIAVKFRTEGEAYKLLYYLLTCRSLTYAQHMAKTLERAGITAIVAKVPQLISHTGCGYCVKVSAHWFSDALVTLKNAGLFPIRVYALYANGDYGEVGL